MVQNMPNHKPKTWDLFVVAFTIFICSMICCVEESNPGTVQRHPSAKTTCQDVKTTSGKHRA